MQYNNVYVLAGMHTRSHMCAGACGQEISTTWRLCVCGDGGGVTLVYDKKTAEKWNDN